MTKSNGAAPDVFGRVFDLKGDLRQRDATAWNRAYLDHTPRAALADEKQAALEAAIVAGWVLSPECRYEDVTDGATGKTSRRFLFDGVDIEDMRPAEVYHYGGLCNDHFNRAVFVPKA